MKKDLKVAVIGAGHLGKIHAKLWKQVSNANLTGIYDINPQAAENLASEHSVIAYNSIDELLENNDAIDIVTPTISHFEIAEKAILLNKHCFIEKPVTQTLEQADKLVALNRLKNVVIQVGHVERFNPAFTEALTLGLKPLFIEAHRLSQFSLRANDVSVVLDLMIHDIDLILSLIGSEVAEIRASGVSVISNEIDIANARIEFLNGSVANLTASRISKTPLRKMRIFSHNCYASIDFAIPSLELFQLTDKPATDSTNLLGSIPSVEGVKNIIYYKPNVSGVNAILQELEAFSNSILNQAEIKVTLSQAAKNLAIAEQILNTISNNVLNYT